MRKWFRRLICKLFGHRWGTAYKSSSGRKVCTRCGFVTDFDTFKSHLGVADAPRPRGVRPDFGGGGDSGGGGGGE